MVRTHRYFAAGVLAAGLLISTSACATGGYYQNGRVATADHRDLDRWAYDNGLREGQRNGDRDARKGAAYRVSNDRSYQKADTGFYRRGSYPLYQYQLMFRQGYEAGYAESYNRLARSSGGGRVRPGVIFPPYSGGGGSGSYASSAARNGFEDGLAAGRDDARSNRGEDSRRPKLYREGDHNYSNRDGSRDDYKRDYRSAFQEGYEQGYRGYRR